MLWIGALAGCTQTTPSSTVTTGIAYVGPATLNLRKDLGSRSSVSATAHHGEKLVVLETRRRLVRVRTSAGVEGWTDFNLLLSEQQMDDLRKLAESAKKLPSQGVATVYEPLNIHAEPSRQSPSFFQLAEGGKVDVIGHRVSLQHPPSPPRTPARRVSASKKKSAGKPKEPFLLPLPSPPPVPKNLEELSRPRLSDLDGYETKQAAPPALDDWALVRTQNGDVGWALARMLVMAIPDEVAQYAEGKRITAYLPLGEVHDKEKDVTKPNWLWTTASASHVPYEFDSFRVFVWSLKHHRYETAYIERNVKGYYPVATLDLPGSEEKGFSVVIEDKDGQTYKRIYGFTGYRVHMISKEPYKPSLLLPEMHSGGNFEPAAPAQDSAKPGLLTWIRTRLGRGSSGQN